VRGLGTLINIAAVLAGSFAGLSVGRKLSDEFRQTAMFGLGLATFAIGFQYCIASQHILALIMSIVVGGIIGHLIGVQKGLDNLGRWFENKLGNGEGRVSRGFVTASLLFCVGPLTIIGCIEDGAKGNFNTLSVKSMLDLFASMALASALGWGVLLSVLTIFIYQGALTVGAAMFGNFIDPVYSVELFACGGLMIIAIGLELCEIKKPPTADYLPALLLSPLFVYLERFILTLLG
jgi:uncharacterized protein